MMDDNLTEVERAELEGLRAASAKGKLLPESAGWERMLELVAIKEGKARGEAAVEEWGVERVMEFYGVSRRFFYEMQDLGKQRGRRVPWEDAVRLGEWFGAMKAIGARKRGAPGEVLKRILAASDGRVIAASVAPALPPLPAIQSKKENPQEDYDEVLTLNFEGESNAADVLQHLRKQISVLQAEIQHRQEKGLPTAALEAKYHALLPHHRQYENSAGKIREADLAWKAAQQAFMRAFMDETLNIIRRELKQEFGPEVDAGINRAMPRIKSAIEERFQP